MQFFMVLNAPFSIILKYDIELKVYDAFPGESREMASDHQH